MHKEKENTHANNIEKTRYKNILLCSFVGKNMKPFTFKKEKIILTYMRLF